MQNYSFPLWLPIAKTGSGSLLAVRYSLVETMTLEPKRPSAGSAWIYPNFARSARPQ